MGNMSVPIKSYDACVYVSNWHLDLLQPLLLLPFALIRSHVPGVSGDRCQYTLHTTVADGYPCTEDDLF